MNNLVKIPRKQKFSDEYYERKRQEYKKQHVRNARRQKQERTHAI